MKGKIRSAALEDRVPQGDERSAASRRMVQQTPAFVQTCRSFETPLPRPSERGRSVLRPERLDSLVGPQALPRFSSACARMEDKVVVGVIALGSTLTCRIEGKPEASARSYAGRNPAVSSTVSP
jgi:hypothetical protein